MPPGAAQASSTRMPAAAARNRGASCAAASCTRTSPSAKPGNALTSTGSARRSASGAKSQESAARSACASRARYSSRVPWRAFTRSHIGGSRLPAAAIDSQRSGQSRAKASSIQSGCAWRAARARCAAATMLSRSRWKRRRIALTRPARAGGRATRAASTVSDTAACSGVAPCRSWKRPTSISVRTSGSSFASGRSRRPARQASSSKYQRTVPKAID